MLRPTACSYKEHDARAQPRCGTATRAQPHCGSFACVDRCCFHTTNESQGLAQSALDSLGLLSGTASPYCSIYYAMLNARRKEKSHPFSISHTARRPFERLLNVGFRWCNHLLQATSQAHTGLGRGRRAEARRLKDTERAGLSCRPIPREDSAEAGRAHFTLSLLEHSTSHHWLSPRAASTCRL